MPKFFSS